MDNRVLVDMIGKGKTTEAMLIVKSEMLKSMEYKGILLTILGTAILSLYSWTTFEKIKEYDFLIASFAFFIILFGALSIIHGNDSKEGVSVLARKSMYVDKATLILFIISAAVLLTLLFTIISLSSWHWRNLLAIPLILFVLYYNHKLANVK